MLNRGSDENSGSNFKKAAFVGAAGICPAANSNRRKTKVQYRLKTEFIEIWSVIKKKEL
jgi:hypothetical protein